MSFKLDRYPVTRSEFLNFVKSHPEWRRSEVKAIFAEQGYLNDWQADLAPGKVIPLQAPVTGVSWFASRAYCQSVGKTLPSTDQWEYAAYDSGRGPTEAAHRSIRWFAKPNGNPQSVGRTQANHLGVHGLYDTIWEWTEDFASASLSTDLSQAGARFSCGGAGAQASDPSDYAAFMRYSFRDSLKASFVTANLGFRCATGTLPVTSENRLNAKELPQDSIFQLDNQVRNGWKNQDGRTVTLKHFQGNPLIVAMIYTRCQATCPLIIAEIKRIEQALPSNSRSKLRVALFSFDSEEETPETLKAFARAHNLDLSRWSVLSGRDANIRDLAAALSVRYKKAAKGVYSHSSQITVLDSFGVPRYQRQELGLNASEPTRILTGLLSDT